MNILGLMSGTSCDGVDLALVKFNGQYPNIEFQIVATEFIPFTLEQQQQLKNLIYLNAYALLKADIALGELFADCISIFIKKYPQYAIDAISSHGHTVVHQPNHKISLQIGAPQVIFATTKIPVVANFRMFDVAIGGQGAPLVPLADLHLFKNYHYCLNLGGIANVSEKTKNNGIIAYDICVCNMALNYVAEKLGKTYDKNGEIAQIGSIDTDLFNQLNQFEFYKKNPPKSLGIEWFNTNMLPLLIHETHKEKDLLRTVTEHIAIQIASCLKGKNNQVLVTGGGTKNNFLIERITQLSEVEIVVPDLTTIDFKEAIAFAYLGYLKLNHRINVLKEVTGSNQDSSSGIIYNF
jgi:anhydro-N-acetylmuramic acid kinase